MTPNDAQDDATAVMNVIEAETAAFYNKDFDAFARCWVHAPYIRRLGWWTRGGVSDRRGWETLGACTMELFRENPEPNRTANEVRRENIVLRVGHDMAWVTFDQYGPDTGEPDMDMPGLSREARVLEKHDGEWKIAYHNYVHQTPDRTRSPMLRVDRQATISWMNAAAEKEIKNNGSVVVRNGHLHATDIAADKKLQATIAWAASRDDKLDGGRGALPVVLDGGAGGEPSVCWVVTEGSGSGSVVVSINDLMFAQDRIEAAAVVYGLSPSQQSIAEQIIAGQDLVRAASNLGVSVTTARTQLQRMFEKTGVRSQPALVRALLSVVSPASDLPV